MNNVRLKDSVQEKFFQNDIPPREPRAQ